MKSRIIFVMLAAITLCATSPPISAMTVTPKKEIIEKSIPSISLTLSNPEYILQAVILDEVTSPTAVKVLSYQELVKASEFENEKTIYLSDLYRRHCFNSYRYIYTNQAKILTAFKSNVLRGWNKRLS